MLAFQNYATFLKNYSVHKLHISDIIRPPPLVFSSGVYPGQVVQALVYPLCSRFLVNYLDVSSLHLTRLAWRPPF